MRPLVPVAIAALMALPLPALADSHRDEARARNLALGIAGIAAVVLAARAADRAADRSSDDDRVDRAEDDVVAWLSRRALPEVARGTVWQRSVETGRDSAGPMGGRVLPAGCLAPVRALEGPVDLYEPDCLGREVARGDELPLACVVTVPTWGVAETGFDPACLAREGWRPA